MYDAKSTGTDSSSDDDVPAITYSVVFKCIGSHKELHYQEVLSQANKRIREGLIVPVKLQLEPNNQFDSRAIAI